MRNKILVAAAILIVGSISVPVFGVSPVISWMMDLYDHPSVKPYEDGNVTEYPLGSVTVNGMMVNSNGMINADAADTSWILTRNDVTLAPVNPISNSPASLANGKYLYGVYCSACHGDDGNAQTSVGSLRGAPAIAPIISSDPLLTDGYLYSRIKYGGININLMPPFGYATTEKERWDIVNYITSEWGYKENGS